MSCAGIDSCLSESLRCVKAEKWDSLPSALSIADLRVEEEWSPGEIVVDRSAINTFGSRSEPRQSGKRCGTVSRPCHVGES